MNDKILKTFGLAFTKSQVLLPKFAHKHETLLFFHD